MIDYDEVLRIAKEQSAEADRSGSKCVMQERSISSVSVRSLDEVGAYLDGRYRTYRRTGSNRTFIQVRSRMPT